MPWAIGGERIEIDGSRGWYSGDWPTIPVSGLRLWDSRTAWLNIEPAPGTYDFTRLDAFVRKAELRGVREIVLVLGGTPRWAATTVLPTDAHWMGPGSASPPRSLLAWSDFVSAVAHRYEGRITAYEIRNEPNDLTFWSGTRAQWAELVAVASTAIRVSDPAARILGSGFSMRRSGTVGPLRPWLEALAARCDGCVDALSVHWYPYIGTPVTRFPRAVSSVKAMAGEMGLPRSIWVTETNVSAGACLGLVRQGIEARRLANSLASAGVTRAYWYAWTDLDPCGSLPLQPGSPAARVLAAP